MTKPRHLSSIAAILFRVLPCGLSLLGQPSGAQSNTSILDPIWRNEPVIGIWLSGGQGLIEVPAYLDGTDFPYTRRPYPREVPFADRLTVVRLLGGWNRRDLGKGESRGYDDIAEADLVSRPFGAPTLRTTSLVDLGPLDCDRDTRRCTGQLDWTVPDDGSGGGHLLITAGDRLRICTGTDGSQPIDWFEIGILYTISVRETQSCPATAAAAAGPEIGTLTVDPSELVYHFDLMKRRLDPYVTQGYTDLTLVLDNIPWALPLLPTMGPHGQTAPPASLAEWTTFVDRLVGALIADYGAGMAGKFRFRLGTEQQSEKRFSGTPEQYLALYEATVAAIRTRLPKVKIGPFNQAGPDDDPTKLNYAFLYDNIADPGDLDYVAHSLYYIPKKGQGQVGNTYPSQRLPAYQEMWTNLPMAPGTSIEFQEFGVLRNAEGVSTNEPGARGAALHAADIFALLAAGADGLWHWSSFERLRVARDKVDTQVLNGRGWLYLVLERFLGGTIYDVSPRSGAGKETGPAYSAHFIDTQDAGALVVSAFNLDQAQDSATPIPVTITLPKELLPAPGAARFEQVSLSQENAVYDRIRADLEREGLLGTELAGAGQPVGDINRMGGFAARRYVAQNWEDYRALITDSLTRTPFTPEIAVEAETYRITLQIPAPSVFVLLVSP